MKRIKVLKYAIPLWLLLMLLFVTPIATAIVIISLTPEKISLFTGQPVNSNFVIDSISTNFKGLNKIAVKLTVRNSDTVQHSANVTVQLLDMSGSLITISGIEMSLSWLTGNIAGGGTVVFTYTFTGTGLVNLYNSHFINIYQLT